MKPTAAISAMFSSSDTSRNAPARVADFTTSRGGGSRARWGALLVAMLLAPCALPAMAQAAQCPNEQLRHEDNSTQLPDCRSYEMVSPLDKNGAAIAIPQPVLSQQAGERVAFASTGVFAGAQAGPLANGYVATRTPNGWSTRGIEIPQANEGLILAVPMQGISEDLTKSFVASAMPLTPGAVQGQGNIYESDNATGERTLVGTSNGTNAFREFGSTIYTTFIAGTPNFSHIVFTYAFALTPGAVEGGSNIYDWSGGQLHLVNYLPDGSVATNASSPIAINGEPHHPISADGSKIFFNAGGVLYVRENDTTTVPISVSQRAGGPTEPQNGGFGGASVDGSIVYFTSTADLTEGPATSPSSQKLYRYDFHTGLITDLTTTTAPSDAEAGPAVQQVAQVSDNGSYVYFTAQGDLAPGATTAPYGLTNWYVWHEGEGVRFIAQATGGGQGSPRGRYFALDSETQLTAYHCNGCSMIYVYDYGTRQLRCASCDPDGAAPIGSVEFGGLPYGPGIDGYHPRVMLDNGSLYFGSQDPLVPQDTNGQKDVYQWQDGRLSLISPGTGDQESVFGDATPDGSNVFFRTGQKLVGQDTDQSVDLYDARVDGGFPAPPSSVPCTGTGCQGVPPAPPIFATPPSATFNGVGNFEPVVEPAARAKPTPTRSQRLAAALKACHKLKAKKKRPACEARARKTYGKAAAVKHGKSSAIKSDRRGE